MATTRLALAALLATTSMDQRGGTVLPNQFRMALSRKYSPKGRKSRRGAPCSRTLRRRTPVGLARPANESRFCDTQAVRYGLLPGPRDGRMPGRDQLCRGRSLTKGSTYLPFRACYWSTSDLATFRRIAHNIKFVAYHASQIRAMLCVFPPATRVKFLARCRPNGSFHECRQAGALCSCFVLYLLRW